LYVPLKNQHLLRTTLPTSWGFIDTPAAESANQGKSAFEILFEWTATEDDAPYFCIPTALQFIQKVCGGEAAIFAYLERLARHGSDAIAHILGTEVMTDPQGDLRRCAMSTIRLPLSIAGGSNEFAKELYPVLAPADVSPALAWIQSKLIRDYKTTVPLFEYSGNLWVRVSAQIYLEKGDYIWLGEILKTLCERVGKEHVVQVEAKL
jgi:PERQ amino acid-rich with GYF domain-containing protein